ncbi:MAG: hypothetical protein O7G87_23150 [bacterium]|nr:hypothetical protein [bacterium]
MARHTPILTDTEISKRIAPTGRQTRRSRRGRVILGGVSLIVLIGLLFF